MYSHSEGCSTCTAGLDSHAEGYRTTAVANGSHTEGFTTCASGIYSHTEGAGTCAGGRYSHAEGIETIASGYYGAHAEGDHSTASGLSGSHAEGYNTTASGNYGSHAEGSNSVASGAYSHAEGAHSVASGKGSHASGHYTEATGEYQTAIGKFNILDTAVSDNTPEGTYAFIIGNGSVSTRSNAFTIDWDGNVDASGTVLGKLKRVGALTGEAPSDVTIATGTAWKELCHFTLTKGVWMVSIAAQFAANATGARAISLGSSTAVAGGIVRTMRTPAASGSVTTLALSFPVEVSATSQTFYLNGYQSSGSQLTVQPRYTAIKLGNSTST
jgi:hypothetical protein